MPWFFVDTTGNTVGPVPFAVLKTKWESKKITQDSKVWHKKKTEEWKKIKKLPWLVEKLNKQSDVHIYQPHKPTKPSAIPKYGRSMSTKSLHSLEKAHSFPLALKNVDNQAPQEKESPFVVIRKKFEQVDTDKSGEIEFGEFYKVLMDLGMEVTEDRAKLIFAMVDLDGSGSIDIGEFTSMVYNAFDGVNYQYMDFNDIDHLLEDSFTRLIDENDPDPYKTLTRLFKDMCLEVSKNDFMGFQITIRTIGVTEKDVSDTDLQKAHLDYCSLAAGEAGPYTPEVMKEKMPHLCKVMEKLGIDTNVGVNSILPSPLRPRASILAAPGGSIMDLLTPKNDKEIKLLTKELDESKKENDMFKVQVSQYESRLLKQMKKVSIYQDQCLRIVGQLQTILASDKKMKTKVLRALAEAMSGDSGESGIDEDKLEVEAGASRTDSFLDELQRRNIKLEKSIGTILPQGVTSNSSSNNSKREATKKAIKETARMLPKPVSGRSMSAEDNRRKGVRVLQPRDRSMNAVKLISK